MKKVIISIMAAAVILAASSCNTEIRTYYSVMSPDEGLVKDPVILVFEDGKVYHKVDGDLVEIPYSATFNGKAVVSDFGTFYVTPEDYISDNFSFEVVKSH